eukprot:TRINITY_DN6798_c0_g1_i1.p1 TRINITY_DN6798_c0_g1~~TRINITY_DN6798_c0_g1_i1.p1  ORF type:complete len:487 (-),score=159.53 TRINITY_DN6798_c0_g1_i1:63-1436(-)
MSSKRKRTDQLTKDDFDRGIEPVDDDSQGVFKVASQDKLQKRRIVSAKRSNGKRRTAQEILQARMIEPLPPTEEELKPEESWPSLSGSPLTNNSSAPATPEKEDQPKILHTSPLTKATSTTDEAPKFGSGFGASSAQPNFSFGSSTGFKFTPNKPDEKKEEPTTTADSEKSETKDKTTTALPAFGTSSGFSFNSNKQGKKEEAPAPTTDETPTPTTGESSAPTGESSAPTPTEDKEPPKFSFSSSFNFQMKPATFTFSPSVLPTVKKTKEDGGSIIPEDELKSTLGGNNDKKGFDFKVDSRIFGTGIEPTGNAGLSNIQPIVKKKKPTLEKPKEELKTGEEEEETIFEQKGKLYKFDSEEKSWKERGIGMVKINSADKRSRILMRGDVTLRLLLNGAIFKGMNISKSSPTDKRVQFILGNHAGEDDGLGSYLLTFKGVEVADDFKQKVEQHIETLGE